MCNNTTVAIFTAVTWTISLALSLMPTLGWSNEGGGVAGPDGEELPVCSFFGLMHPDYLRLSVSLYFVPFATMIVLYVHIFKVIVLCVYIFKVVVLHVHIFEVIVLYVHILKLIVLYVHIFKVIVLHVHILNAILS